ncbi:MAG: putative mutase [Clostridiaceae bacterium]|nr:putative mutase [Clostridiaceae bacterium]
MKRFIVIVLDSFGVGYMEDAKIIRPQDVGANTCKHIIENVQNLMLPNLMKLGIMNALGEEIGNMKKSNEAVFGKAELMHFGADTFLGHQEIMGTRPKKPVMEPFSCYINKVYNELVKNGYKVEYKGDKLKFLLVNGCVTVADNIEADYGQVYNLTSTFDLIPYEEVIKIGKIVRSVVHVSRVIAFGGENVTIEQILGAVEEKEGKYIGINAPKSGVYSKGYEVIHLGYGINPEVQLPTILGKNKINVTLIGKVADIVENRYGKSIPRVDTEDVMKITVDEVNKEYSGFICTNVQETDLAGHGEDVIKYAEKLKIADKYIGIIMEKMNNEDILVVMADHGNDPTIGHSHHTREYVPLLIYNRKIKSMNIGTRKSLSDVGATAAKFFNVEMPENGQTFF